MTRVLFVCLGNICRSPTAEALMRRHVERAGLQQQIEVDSAGTGDWHIGQPPDARASAAAAERGVQLAGQARQVTDADFKQFEVIVALDRSVLATLQDRAGRLGASERLRLLVPSADVPDPYHGGPQGFAQVFELIDRCCADLLTELPRT